MSDPELLEQSEAMSSPALTASWAMPDFQIAPHVEALDDFLLALADRQITRGLVHMPPRHGKTTMCSRVFPPWYLGWNPTHNVMLLTGTDAMASRAGLGARSIADLVLPGLFGRRIHPDYAGRYQWKLDGTGQDEGGFICSSIGGSRTMGAGADLVIVDDQFGKVEDALSEPVREKHEQAFLADIMSRLTPNAIVLIVETRWHRKDLIGLCQRATDEDWAQLTFPALATEADQLGRKPGDALWPDRYPVESLLAIRRRHESRGYPWMFQALYQGDPPEVLDVEWPADYFDHNDFYFDSWPEGHACEFRIVSLDPSLGRSDKSDYSAFVKAALGVDGLLYIDADLARRDITRQVVDGMAIAEEFEALALSVEINAFQEALAVIFRDKTRGRGWMIPIIPITQTANKIMRIRAFITPYLAEKKVKFRRGSPGVALLLEQLRTFPASRYADGPDALAQAIHVIQDFRLHGSPLPPGVTNE